MVTLHYPDSEECYRDVYRLLSMNMNQGGKAIFRSLTSDLDDITVTLGGGVKLQVVFGDITNETTDAVVNTTDFINFQTGVCRDILTVAGPQVEAELRNTKVNRGDVFKTQPGSFPCKAILHIGGEKDATVVEQLVCSIIQLCESSGYKSVAIPAICAGAGGLDADLVARVILRGINITASSSPLRCVTNIRLMLMKINVFLAFKKQVMQMFPSAVINTVAAAAPQPPPPQVVNIDPNILCSSSTVQQSVFTIVGLRRESVDNAMTLLKSLYESQCSTQTFRKEELAGLSQDDMNGLKQLIEDLGVLVEEEQSGRGGWTVSGLKEGVNQVMQMIHKSVILQLEVRSMDIQHPLIFEAISQQMERKGESRDTFRHSDCRIGGNMHKDVFTEENRKALLRKLPPLSVSWDRDLTMSRTSSLCNLKPIYQPYTGQSQKECPVGEEQFKLVEEEYFQVMSTHCTAVKIFRGKGNTIILKGPDNEVQSGAARLYELTKKVLEKRVKLPIDLITFIKSSDAISKYQIQFQSFKNPVFLEVGSDLVLFSLSSHALDDAFQTLLKDLSVEIVKLQAAAAVSPDLDRVKEVLIKAKNQINCGKLRVDVSFIPEHGRPTVTKVRLVGYSEDVKKLREILHDYQINQAVIEEVLDLPNPDLVDCFNDILEWIDVKQTKVTFKFFHSLSPGMLLCGPRCHVQETKQALTSALASLISDALALDGPGALRYFRADGKVSKELVESSFKVLIRERKGGYQKNKPPSIRTITPRFSISPRWCKTPASMVVKKPSLEIKLGSLVDEQVNVLVVPMLGMQLSSTKIGKCLLSKAGNAIRRSFDLMAAKGTIVPGDVLEVDGPPSLGCSKIFFVECLRWDGVNGQSEQALSNGLKRCLDLCVQHGCSSVALPVIGPGVALQYPWRKAFQILSEKIFQFASSSSSGSLSNINIVIKPDHYSEECYHDVYQHLKLKIKQRGQEIFRSLTSDLDDIIATMGGGVKLQVVFGDIINETTDAVVNTTDFINFHTDGTCRNILSVAGPNVEALLKTAKVNQGDVFRTPPGSFPCKAILHVSEEKDAGAIEQLVCCIIQHCESAGYRSVAIPAISAGADGLDPGVAAHAILQGIKTATSSFSLRCLTSIRLVLMKIKVFSTFKKQMMQMFPPAVINTVSGSQLLRQPQQQSPVSVNPDLSILHSSSSQQSIFLFVGRCRKDVNDAMVELKNLYQAHCSTKIFTKDDLEDLTQDDLKDLKQLVETEGLYVKEDQPGQGGLMVSGLKDGINQVVQMLHTTTPLRREMRVRDEDDLYSRVTWCILGLHGSWERLPKTANLNLERNNVTKGIVDTQGILWSVDLRKMEAKRQVTGGTTKLKRHEHLPDFTFPLYWDTMAVGESLKVVALQPSSVEYRTVEQKFTQTVHKTVIKIERLQNVYLRRAYDAWKNHISEKNGQDVGAGEKLLYHGTSQDTCESIQKNGFDRGFSGKNATSFGQGTYFAVKASYSARSTYSKIADDGSQAVFVARVLTGFYTQGNSSMRVPPRRDSSHDYYDSVVDRIDNPSMYVVFHDNQAYPDYLITFC